MFLSLILKQVLILHQVQTAMFSLNLLMKTVKKQAGQTFLIFTLILTHSKQMITQHSILKLRMILVKFSM